MMTRRRILNALLVVAVIGAGVAVWTTVGASASSRSSAPVTYDATSGTVLSTVSASGTVQAAQQVNVNFTTGGTLTELDVKNGDQVAAGQVLAKVDPGTAQASLDLANAQLTSVQVQLTAAEDTEATAAANAASGTATESVSGGSSGSGSGSASGSAASVAQAQASVLSAQNQVAAAQKTLDATTLVAPVAGTVSGLTAQVGATVSGGTTSSSGAASSSTASSGSGSSGTGGSGGGSAGSGSSATGSSSSAGSSASSGSSTTFLVITDLSVMDVQASFTEADAVKVHVGQKVIVTFSALPNVTVQGEVAQIATSATTSNGVVSFAVVVTLDQTPPGLRPGMTANAQVVVDEADNVLLVPSSAINGTGTTATVTVVGSDGKQDSRTVTVGLRGDSSVQITSGLVTGDKIVRTTTTSTGSSAATTTGARTATGSGSGSGTLGGGLTGGGGFTGGPRGGG